jgi:hypothetical protein
MQVIYYTSITEAKSWAVRVVWMGKSRHGLVGKLLGRPPQGGSKDSVKELRNRSRSCNWLVLFPLECSSNYKEKYIPPTHPHPHSELMLLQPVLLLDPL